MMRPSLRLLAASILCLLAACGGSPAKPTQGDAASGDALTPNDTSDASAPVDKASAPDADASAPDAADAPPEAPPKSDAAGDLVEVGAEAPPASGSSLRALAVTTGALHTCALLENHRIKCWGDNTYGQLGYGDKRTRGAVAAEMGNALPFVYLGRGLTVTTVAAGRYHTCALLDDGAVKCWGLAGQQGVEPGPTFNNNIGDDAGEMGDALRAVDLGAGRRAVQLAAGFAWSCAVLDDGTARCWGPTAPILPTAVALGSTAKVHQLAPSGVGALALFEDGTVSSTLPTGGSPGKPTDKVSYVAGSQGGMCFVLAGGGAQCRSASTKPPTTTSLVAMGVTEHGNHACGILASGDVRCWGSFASCDAAAPGTTYWCGGTRGADGAFATALGQRALALATGALYHMCAVLADGGVKCWVTFDPCAPGAASEFCPVPPSDKQDTNLGASVEIVTTAGKRSYGAWRAIDLGKWP